MLIATAVMLLGLLAGVVVAQLRGLRLGGVIVVPLTAVYLLRSFQTAPIFLLSVLAAYVSLWIVKRQLLVFGRTLFIVAVVVGAFVPVAVFGFATGGPLGSVTLVDFMLSIMPGIAAFNLHRLSQDDRILDALWGLATLLFLVVVGIALVIAVGLTPLADYMPPLLLGEQSDIANAFNLTVDGPSLAVITSRWELFWLFASGLVVSEVIRSRYGLRVGGVIIVPAVVLMSFRNGSMFPLWVVTTLLVFAAISFVHWWTLVYGRVLLSMSVIFGLFVALSFTPAFEAGHGLLPFFVGIFSGVTAYNVHVVPPVERPANTLVLLSVFVATTTFARLLITPPPGGFLTAVTAVHVVVGCLLFVPGLVTLVQFERRFPIHRRLSPSGVTHIVPDTESDRQRPETQTEGANR